MSQHAGPFETRNNPNPEADTIETSKKPMTGLAQKNIIEFTSYNRKIVFDSRFDSGNLKTVQRHPTNPNHYLMWTASDCEGTDNRGYYKSWFYFSVTGASSQTLTFSIHRMHLLYPMMKYPQRYRPVYRVLNKSDGELEDSSFSEWRRLDHNIQSITMNNSDQLILTFTYTFDDNPNQVVEFAFTYPYTYEQCQKDIASWERDEAEKRSNENDPNIVHFSRHLLIQSVKKREIDVLVITANEGRDGKQVIEDQNILAGQAGILPKFGNKPIILITARVHPAETPASYCMNGIVSFLLNRQDARSYFLRKNFVFVLIPMLNPDGVAHGHCRMDTLNQNLNRHYKNPRLDTQPSCYAVMKLAQHYNKTGRLYFYLDLHAHPANKGNFLFGNAITDYILQVESSVYPRFLSMNCVNFDLEACNFSRKQMKTRDRYDEPTKEGCGRVVLHKQFGLVHSYTVQCGYHANVFNNSLDPPANTHQGYKLRVKKNNGTSYIQETMVKNEGTSNNNNLHFEPDSLEEEPGTSSKEIIFYTPETFRNLGKNLLVTLLDLWRANPYPRIQDPDTIRHSLAKEFTKVERFRREQSNLKLKEKNIIKLIEEQHKSSWSVKSLKSGSNLTQLNRTSNKDSKENEAITSCLSTKYRSRNSLPRCPMTHKSTNSFKQFLEVLRPNFITGETVSNSKCTSEEKNTANYNLKNVGLSCWMVRRNGSMTRLHLRRQFL